jgi:hypothetical protein
MDTGRGGWGKGVGVFVWLENCKAGLGYKEWHGVGNFSKVKGALSSYATRETLRSSGSTSPPAFARIVHFPSFHHSASHQCFRIFCCLFVLPLLDPKS